jgi:hypothetical protein
VKLFLTIVTVHFVEHLAQIYQLYFLHWERSQCKGALGLWQPWLMHSETLHYTYAVFMLIGLFYLKERNVWWRRAYYLQHYHHIEHLLLVLQMLAGFKPTGIGGIWFPRIELHFFYNLAVMLPMAIALYEEKNVSGDSM